MRPKYWCATAEDGWRCQLDLELGNCLVELLRRFAITLLRCEFVERPFKVAHALSDALGLCGRALSVRGEPDRIRPRRETAGR